MSRRLALLLAGLAVLAATGCNAGPAQTDAVLLSWHGHNCYVDGTGRAWPGVRPCQTAEVQAGQPLLDLYR